MKTVRRARWWLLIGAVLAASGTVAMASSLSLTSSNLTVYRTCVLSGYPNTTTYNVDAWADQNSPAANNGTTTSMNVQSLFKSNKHQNQRSFVSFDLTRCSPAVPSSASVKVATLRLMVSALPAACRTQDVFRATASWTEGGITWATQPATSASRTSSANVGPTGCANSTINTYVSWDVTSDVQSFVAGTTTNDGWMLRDDVEDATSAQTTGYYTKETAALASAPQLVVNYS
jgi:hypothetical protein